MRSSVAERCRTRLPVGICIRTPSVPRASIIWLAPAVKVVRPAPVASTLTACVFRGRSDIDSNFCRTAFRFLPDTVPIHIGQRSGLIPDSFRAPLEWCPTGSEWCPSWPGTVSDRDRTPGWGGVERRWNGCQGSGSIRVNRERHLMARTKLTMRQIQEILRLKHQNQLSIRRDGRNPGTTRTESQTGPDGLPPTTRSGTLRAKDRPHPHPNGLQLSGAHPAQI